MPEPAPSAGAAPLFGRDAERSTCATALADAASGSGRVLLIGSERGLGKSYLLAALGEQAGQAGVEVVHVHCEAPDGAPRLWPWSRALRAWARGRDADALAAHVPPDARRLAQLVPELGELCAEPESDASVSAEFELFEEVRALLESSARSRPLCLLLDDLDTVDEDSLRLARFIALAADQCPLLLAITYSEPADPDRPWSKLLADLVGQRAVREVALRPLDDDAIEQLVRALVPIEIADETLVALQRAAGGNPMFARQIAQHWEARGLLSRPSQRPGWIDRAPLELPDSVLDAARSRLDARSDECRQLLDAASVLGERFKLDDVRAALGLNTAQVSRALDEAVAAGVLRAPDASPLWEFDSPLLQHALYSAQNVEDRRRMHLRIARGLEIEHLADPTPALGAIATHYFEAGSLADPDKTIGCLEAAALIAEKAGDDAAALRMWNYATHVFQLKRHGSAAERERLEGALLAVRRRLEQG